MKFGVDWIKSQMHIHSTCRTLNEIQSYKYREERRNVLEEPVDMNNHRWMRCGHVGAIDKAAPLNLEMDLDFGRRESPWRLR